MVFDALTDLGTGFWIFYSVIFAFCMVISNYTIKAYAYIFSFAFFLLNILLGVYLFSVMDAGTAAMLAIVCLLAFAKSAYDFTQTM